MVILFLLLFLGLTFWNVYKTHDLDLSTFDGMTKAGKVYFSWLGSLLSNTKAVTTYAIKQDWNVNTNISATPINTANPGNATTNVSAK